MSDQAMAEQTCRTWHFDGTDAVTAVRLNGYITNAKALGMKKGDIIRYVKTNDNPVSVQSFIVTAINANGSADLSDGSATTATNTD